MSEIGRYLRSLREGKKMSLRTAADVSGLSHSYIRYLEDGKRPGSNTPINPSPDTLKRLAETYNFPYEELMKKAGYINEGEPLLKESNVPYETRPYEDIMKEIERKYPGVNLNDPEIKKKLMKVIDFVLDDYQQK